MKNYLLLPLAVLLSVYIAGCSAGGDAIAPAADKVINEITTHSTNQCLGLWQFIANPEAETLEIIQLRCGAFHLNALPFLEPPALVNLTLESLKFNGNIIEADIGLRHPFLGLTEFTGFDVCGIFITNGSVTGFSDADLRIAGSGDTRLLNPDGYSRWWNPAEFPINTGTIFGYNDGLLGTKDSVANFNSTLNAYKYFCDELGPNDAINKIALGKRGMFSPGQKNIRHYTIEMGAGLVFNYAVDACWQFPNGPKPWTAPDDFGENANRPEAYRIVVTETTNTLYNDGSVLGGDLSLSIDVYDWFNAGHNTVKVESPENFTIQTSSTPAGGCAGYSTYEIDIVDATPSPDNINLLIHIASDSVGYAGLLPGKNVTAYFTRTVAVSNEPPIQGNGWARTWGGGGSDFGYSVDTDSSGNIYATGFFQGTVNFNPDPTGTADQHTSKGVEDVFLCKYNPDGVLLWTKTWGGGSQDVPRAVALDSSGNAYVAGYFEGTCNFNPEPGTPVNRNALGGTDVFVSKLNSSGQFQWVRTWGGSGDDYGWGVGVDSSGGVYVGGFFEGSVNFDPDGPVPQIHSSKGARDPFLCKWNSSGAFQWAKTWGGTANDYGYFVAAESSGNIYITGHFEGSVNFNPDSGTPVNITSNGYTDIFLSAFNSSGQLQWAKGWGGDTYDYAGLTGAVAIDGLGNVFVTGDYQHTVEFNPWGTPDIHTAGNMDPFVSKFNSNGVFQWAKVWGGPSHDRGYAVAADNEGNSYISGHFRETTNFNPNPGTPVEFTSHGLTDVFIIKLNPVGELQWANAFGAAKDDFGYGVCADSLENAYLFGCYQETVNFNPDLTAPPDNHTSNGGYDVFLCKYLPDGGW